VNKRVSSIKGWFCSLLGGNANNGANAGFGYLNANNRPANANANIGARLYRINEICKCGCDLTSRWNS